MIHPCTIARTLSSGALPSRPRTFSRRAFISRPCLPSAKSRSIQRPAVLSPSSRTPWKRPRPPLGTRARCSKKTAGERPQQRRITIGREEARARPHRSAPRMSAQRS
eukprot:Amastigsp_a4588_90.p4 type:complete len:107 gc:universal Amastigsp_a4588_90:438-758(+)